VFSARQVSDAVAAVLNAVPSANQTRRDGVFVWWSLRRPRYFNTASLLPRPVAQPQGSLVVNPIEIHRARAIYALREVLQKDPSSETRLSAAKALGQITTAKDPLVLGALVKGLADSKKEVRRACVMALALTGSPLALTQVRQLLRNRTIHSQLRGMALLGLGLSGAANEADRMQLIQACAMNTQENTRHGAILGLGSLGAAQARAVLRRIVANVNRKKDDRMLAAAGLNSAGTTQDVITLVGIARADGSTVGEAAILALGGLAQPSAIPLLIKLTRDARTRRGRGYAYLSLGRYRETQNTVLMLDRLKREPKNVKPWIALGLGLNGDEAAIQPLRAWLAKLKDNDDRYPAARLALGLLRDNRPGKVDGEVPTAFCASSALGMARVVGSVPQLWSRFDKATNAPDLRVNCIRALVMMTQNWAPYQKRLTTDLTAKNRIVRASAVRALGELPSYAGLRRMIQVMRTDKDAYVRDEACLGVGTLLSRGRHRLAAPYRRIAELGFRIHPLALGGSRLMDELLRYLFS